jgi:hypothetical protein
MSITTLFTIPSYGNNRGALQLMNGSSSIHHTMNVCYKYTMEYYSAIRNNDLWFEGKWMHVEDIMSSEVSHAQKDKGHMFSLICRR